MKGEMGLRSVAKKKNSCDNGFRHTFPVADNLNLTRNFGTVHWGRNGSQR